MEYLFTYGLLQDHFDNEFAKMLAERGDLVGRAYTYGSLYEIDHYPGLIISNSNNGKVYGQLYSINDSTILDELDVFEEFGENFPCPNEYKREQIIVFINKQAFKAWAYLYNRKVNESQRILIGDYIQYLHRKT